MNFRRRRIEEPEINLIAFIDVLLVILIFLMLSTTYSRFTQLQLRVPTADVEPMRQRPNELVVAVGAEGAISVDNKPVLGRGVQSLAAAISQAATAGKDTVLVISADAQAKHQSVVTVMEAARNAGLHQITFATQSAQGGTAR
jgi:biopolymer transport protein ExbD